MAASPLSMVIQDLRRFVFLRDALHMSDEQLLDAFVRRRDDVSFEVLVRRHGAMVMGICRRVLRRHHDAEDAFQATFLVLARKAASILARGSLASWLYSVALNAALRTKGAIGRRREGIEDMKDMPERKALTKESQDELYAMLDRELSRLPEKHRAAIVLCDLQGKTRQEAAELLGCPEGTVASRLARARTMLAKRLAQRGVTLSAGALAGHLSMNAASANLSAALVKATCSAAILYAARQALTGAVSSHVAAIAEGVCKAMFVTKLKTMTLAALAIGFATFGGSEWAQSMATSVQDNPAGAVAGDLAATTKPAAAPVQKEEAALPSQAKTSAAPGPQWKEKIVLELPGWLAGSMAYSPDGKTMVAGGSGGKVVAYDRTTYKEKWQANVGGSFTAIAFTADGKSVMATFNDGVRFLDAENGNLGDSIAEPGCRPLAIGAFPDREFVDNGRKLIRHKIVFGNEREYYVKDWVPQAAPGTIQLTSVSKGKEPADPNAAPLAIDPAGRSVILMGPVLRGTGKNVLWAWVAGDYDEGSPGNRILEGHAAPVVSAAWAKDGKTAVSGDASGRIIFWDAQSMKETRRVEFGERIAALAISADGKWTAAVAIGKQARFFVWETASPADKLKPLHVDASDIGGAIRAGLAFSPDGQQLTGTAINMVWLVRLGELVGKIHVWDLVGR